MNKNYAISIREHGHPHFHEVIKRNEPEGNHKSNIFVESRVKEIGMEMKFDIHGLQNPGCFKSLIISERVTKLTAADLSTSEDGNGIAEKHS